MTPTFGELAALVVFVAAIGYIILAQFLGFDVREEIGSAITLALGYIFGSRTSQP